MQILSNEVSNNFDMDIFNMFLIVYKILKYNLTSRDTPRRIPKTIVALCKIDNIRYSTHFTFSQNTLNNISNKTMTVRLSRSRGLGSILNTFKNLVLCLFFVSSSYPILNSRQEHRTTTPVSTFVFRLLSS